MTEGSLQPVERLKRRLLDTAISFLGDATEGRRSEFRSRLEAELSTLPDERLARLFERLASQPPNWAYAPADPAARALHHAMADVMVDPSSELLGVERILAGSRAPTVVLANHLSYSDANALEILLERTGHADLAARLTVLAGPKVFEDPFRHFSSLCFGTIKAPQNAGVASGSAAGLSKREIAAAARQTLDQASQRLAAGDLLLIFLEGTRSRSHAMNRGLPAIARYFAGTGTRIIPAGIAGTERLVPLGQEVLRPARIRIQLGPPLCADSLRALVRTPRAQVDVVGLAIAACLAPGYRGAYADSSELGEARAIYEALCAGTSSQPPPESANSRTAAP